MAEKILIIDDDIDTLKLVGLMLQKHGYQIIAANQSRKGLEQAEKENPDLILLDVMMPELDGYEIARQLRASPVTVNTPILMFTAKTQLDDKVTGFESGADDYLTKPTHPTELHAHVKSLLARSKKGKGITNPLPEKNAFIIGIVSPRGGLGISTISANLGDALIRAGKKPVIVAELRPGMGTLGPEMGVPDPKGLVEIISNAPDGITQQNVEESLSKHPTGVQFLFGTVQPKDAALINRLEPFSELVKILEKNTSYLILDMGAGLTPVVQSLLPLCNLVLVIVEPVQNSVLHARAFIADLINLGIQKQDIQVIVNNRIRTEVQMNLHQVEELLGQTPMIMITPAPELLYTANRMKTTAVSAKPDSMTGQQFTQLANAVTSLIDNPQ